MNNSPAGVIKFSCNTEKGFVYECTVPVSSTLYFPILTDEGMYTVNGQKISIDERVVQPGGDVVRIELEPGDYTFVQK